MVSERRRCLVEHTELLLQKLLLVPVLDEDVVALHALLGVSCLHLRGYLLPVLLATVLIQQLKQLLVFFSCPSPLWSGLSRLAKLSLLSISVDL